MAIRFRILFALGLFLLNGSILSVQTYVNNVIETPLKFSNLTLNNPRYVLATGDDKTPIYLHCQVSSHVDGIKNDFLTKKKFYLINPEKDEVDEHISTDEVQQFYKDLARQYNKKKNVNILQTTTKPYKNPSNKNEIFKINANDKNDKINTEDEQEEEKKVTQHRVKLRTKREATRDSFSYEWLRDDETILSFTYSMNNKTIKRNGYTLFSNGTIQFVPSRTTAGVYRCKASYTYIYEPPKKSKRRNENDEESKDFQIGPILSESTNVEVNDENLKETLVVREHEMALIPCPIVNSITPNVNITWFFNNTPIYLNDMGSTNDVRRHFHMLKNGSLVILKAHLSDSGKYRCERFPRQPLLRNPFTSLIVMSSRSDDDSNDEEKALLAKLGHSIHKIKSGESIELSCGSDGKKISWTFKPRSDNRSISLPDTRSELKIKNASKEEHDGFYNCLIENETHTFEIIVTTPPILLNKQDSIVTEVTMALLLSCNVSGSPLPKLEWYRNGELVEDSYIKYATFPFLRILSVEPFDEGFYQCFARNDYGEASSTFYLHVHPRNLLNDPPLEPECHSTDDGNLRVTFKPRVEDKFSNIQYIAAYNTSVTSFDTGVSSQILASENFFTISRSSLRSVESLKPFHLYMRYMLMNVQTITMSLLSKPITCAFQQIEPSLFKGNGSFLGWNVDVSDENLSKTIITIQFLKNNNTDSLSFSNEIVGSYKKFNESKTWADIEKSLQKISVNSSDHGNYTEIKVPGNVTGILIIKVEEMFVRIFGSIEENGTHIIQDNESVKWRILKSPHETITVSDIQARSIVISWKGLDSNKCLQACTYLKSNSPIFLRDSTATKLNCEKITNSSAKSFYINKLSPTSDYDVFITDCEGKNELSTRENIQTTRDVPGPITNPSIAWDRGLVLKWNEPKNPNGIIHYYTIEWTLNNVTHNASVTECFFKFPNTKPSDRISITVRAIGEEGAVGNPFHSDSERWGNAPSMHVQSSKFNPFMIFAIILISIVLVLFVIGLVLCKQNRYCKNNSNGIINSEQSSFSPSSPCMENNLIRNDEMFEMQTLIPTSQVNAMVNGKDNSVKSEILVPSTQNGTMSIDKILRTSTPTDDMSSVVQIELPPIKASNLIDERKLNGNMKISENIQPTSLSIISAVPNKTSISIALKNPLKVNGNSSPYKSLQSSTNDQNTSSSTSSTSSFSSGQLIDINLCNGANNNNNNHHHDRGKAVGKSSSIETDNDEEDSEENMHEYDFNDSNSSTKPLHSWNYRPTLVGPNG